MCHSRLQMQWEASNQNHHTCAKDGTTLAHPSFIIASTPTHLVAEHQAAWQHQRAPSIQEVEQQQQTLMPAADGSTLGGQIYSGHALLLQTPQQLQGSTSNSSTTNSSTRPGGTWRNGVSGIMAALRLSVAQRFSPSRSTPEQVQQLHLKQA